MADYRITYVVLDDNGLPLRGIKVELLQLDIMTIANPSPIEAIVATGFTDQSGKVVFTGRDPYKLYIARTQGPGQTYLAAPAEVGSVRESGGTLLGIGALVDGGYVKRIGSLIQTEALNIANLITNMTNQPNAIGGWLPGREAATSGLEGAWGISRPFVLESGTASKTVDSAGYKIQLTTGAVINNYSGMRTNEVNCRRDMRAYMIWKFHLGQTTAERFFVGLTDQINGVMVGADNPAGHYCGLSVASGGTYWRFICKDGTTQQVATTAIAVDAVVHFVGVYTTPTLVFVGLYSATAVLLSSTYWTTSLPGLTTGLYPEIEILTTAAAAKYLAHYLMYQSNYVLSS